jgi:hypothetical protein
VLDVDVDVVASRHKSQLNVNSQITSTKQFAASPTIDFDFISLSQWFGGNVLSPFRRSGYSMLRMLTLGSG